jgi:ribosome-binding protein aMBF1 (putative translation factor)
MRCLDDNKPDKTGTISRSARGRNRPPRKQVEFPMTDQDRRLQSAIGREVRALRREQKKTIAELSAASGLSMSMLSKIENGVISPSLTSLQALGAALSVPLTTLFRNYDDLDATPPGVDGMRPDGPADGDPATGD